MPAQSFAKQAKKYETIQRIFSWLSIASFIGTYLPIFFFLNNP
jgi:cytochrome b561